MPVTTETASTSSRHAGDHRDCEHKQADHQHGTRLAYVLDRCRCDDCREANNEYARRDTRRRAAAAFDPSYSRLVDATPAREHLLWLASQGMGLKTVSRLGGIAHGTLYVILRPKGSVDPAERRPMRKRITRDVSDRILAVQPVLADGAKVDATGTTRRLQGLVAIGWPQSHLADRLGIFPGNITGLMHGTQAQVREATRKQVESLYDELWATPGPDSRARLRAARKGWAVPLAWDDDTIDDPQAQPFTGTTTGRTSGRSREHVVEDFLDTMDHHQGDIRLAAMRLGVGWSGLTQALVRARRAGADLPTLRNGYRSGVAA